MNVCIRSFSLWCDGLSSSRSRVYPFPGSLIEGIILLPPLHILYSLLHTLTGIYVCTSPLLQVSFLQVHICV